MFDGTELSVTCVRSSLGPNTRPGLELVRIAEIASERGPTLVRARARFVPIVAGVNDRDPLRFPDPVVLLRAPYPRVLLLCRTGPRLAAKLAQRRPSFRAPSA